MWRESMADRKMGFRTAGWCLAGTVADEAAKAAEERGW
jgi:hypothetical protein